ncbi:MAG: histidine--tRNA ligase [Caldicoprobacterales bacterium]|jgi:histidyl-tRNA synthetase|nr:histidine--tRNA ligase [Clostridia bacterium]MDI9511860.1 histidine--tRNA ligase [Bacillota bacterium]
MLTRAPKGTKDILPSESYSWQYVEEKIRQIARLYGYREIRTPIFEHTDLFVRSVGDTTDIVQKEMFTFEDKGKRSITLKPEGTAGVVRAYIEHSLYAEPQPIKVYYITPCFRHERPQAGRQRQFNQFGVEVFGGKEASLDAEIISLAVKLFDSLAIKGLKVNLNSIGCPDCRGPYHEKIKEYLGDNINSLCKSCSDRYEKNPLRILDCKEEGCKALIAGIPLILDNLCDECKDHFDQVKAFLDAKGIDYQINPLIVRGLDYYTKTVFEIISDSLGAQSTVCGGGRYDGLVEECGGPKTPGIGFAIGLERLMMILEAQKAIDIIEEPMDIYIATIGDMARLKASDLISVLRKKGISADMDHVGRSIKAQFKYAGKQGYKFVCTIGENELTTGDLRIKNMKEGKEDSIRIESLLDYLIKQLGGSSND